jgi:mannose-6-phosphate isomerase-like protein (cupin superfamily)
VDFKERAQRAKEMAEDKIARGESADEFVEIGEADGFKLYVAAGKTLRGKISQDFHENPRDVFMLILRGEMQLIFENREKKTVRANQCFVLPKHIKHKCIFRRLTITVEGVYEKGL